MPCVDLETLLRYVDDDTNTGETTEVKRHMAQCPTCYQALETLEALSSNLTKLAHNDAECADAMLLAAYVEQRLTAAEQARVEQHVHRCQSCFDEVAAAQQRLLTVTTGTQTAPPSLLAAARAMAAGSRQAPEPAFWSQLRQQLQDWAASLLPQPQWGLALGGVAAAVILVVVVVRAPWHTPTESVVQTPPGPRTYGYGFGTAEDVLVAGRVPLSAALRQALIAYQAQPTAAARTQLLALLHAAAVVVPDSQVSAIELKPSLQALAEPGQDVIVAVQVTLFKDGLLVLGEAL